MFLPYSHENESKRFPFVTSFLLFLNLAVFLQTSRCEIKDVVTAWGFIPSQHHWLTVFSGMFIHVGFFHFIGNMYVLWLFGGSVEAICGPWFYLLLYICSHVVGLTVYTLTALKTGLTIPIVGASFAISGVLGMYVILFPYAKIRSYTYLAGVISFRSWFLIGYWFTFQLLMASLALKHQLNIGYWGHVGGFLFGLGAGYLVKKNYPKPDDFLLPQEKIFEHEEGRLKRHDKTVEHFFVQEEHSKTALVTKVEDTLNKEGLAAGVEEYKKLENLPLGGALPAADQKRVADELYYKNEYLNALQAYLVFLNQYPQHIFGSEVSCRVGSILSDLPGDELPAIHYLIRGIADKMVPQNIQTDAQKSLEKVRSRIKDLEKESVPLSQSGRYSVLLLCLDKEAINFQEIHQDFSEIGMIGDINIGQKLCFNADEEAGINDSLILDYLNLEEAKIAKAKLIEKGVDVIVLPKGDHTGYPICTVIKGQIAHDSLTMTSEEGGAVHLSKANILHTSLAEFYYEELGPVNENKDGICDVESKTREEMVAEIAMGIDTDEPNFRLENIGMNSVLDIFTTDLTHYRICSRKFIYQDTTVEKRASKDCFGRFVEDYMRIVGDQRVDFNTKLFAANNTFSGLVYKSVVDYEKKSFLLAMYKYYYQPRSD